MDPSEVHISPRKKHFSILQPNLKDFANLSRYLVEDKHSRDALQQDGALKIMPPPDWEYRFNLETFDAVFKGNSNPLSFTNVELVDELSFRRFFDLFLKADDLLLRTTIADDLKLCASKFGVDLYKLYKAHFVSSLKLTDKRERLKYTCASLGISSDIQDEAERIIDKYLIKFQDFLCLDKKEIDLNSPSKLSRHLHLVRSIHVSSHTKSNSSKIQSPLPLSPIQPTFRTVEKLLNSKRWNRVEKLKLMSRQYRKKVVHVKQRQATDPSVHMYFKKVTGLRKSNGRVTKAKSQSNGEVVGVRSTRSGLRRYSAPEPTTNGTEDDKSDTPSSHGSETAGCRECGMSDVPRSELRHCSACDLYFHAVCATSQPADTDFKKTGSQSQWQCPICFSLNWLRGAVPRVTIPDGETGGNVFKILRQHETATNRYFRLSQENDGASFLEHFWQVVLHGGDKHTDISIYTASTNQISGFEKVTPGAHQFYANILQGDFEDPSYVPELELHRLTMDSVYSTRGFSQETFAAPCIHFLHRGAKKTWYVVRNAAQFNTLLKILAPCLFSTPRHNLGLLSQVPLLLHPEDLLNAGIECDVFEQHEGEFVLFPAGAVKAYVSHGASISEETVLPLPQWVPALGRYFSRSRDPRNQLSHGALLASLTHSILFTLPLKYARRLFNSYKQFVEDQLSARIAWITAGAGMKTITNVSADNPFQNTRCSFCQQKFFLTALEYESNIFCLNHTPALADEKKKDVKLCVTMSTREVERQAKKVARKFKLYDQLAQSVTLLQDIHKKPDATDLKELLDSAKKHGFTNNVYFEHLVTNEKVMLEFEEKFVKTDKTLLSLAQLQDLSTLASYSDFSLPGEADLAALLQSASEPRTLLRLYSGGRLSLAALRLRVKTLVTEHSNLMSRETVDTLTEVIKIGTKLEELTHSVQNIHECDEERLEQLIEESEDLPPSEELETCLTILREVLEERVDWRNKALDLLDLDEPKAPLDEWVRVMERGTKIADYGDLKTKLAEQIRRAKEFEAIARGIIYYEDAEDQILTHDVEEIALLLEKADENIHVKLDTFDLLSKEHKDAGIWLRLADLCFLWPKSELEIISILMPKTFSPSLSPYFTPLVPTRKLPLLLSPPTSLDTILKELISQDKREILRTEYQALMSLRAYHSGKQTDGISNPNDSPGDNSGESVVKNPSQVCFCGKHVGCSLIFCYLCRNYYHEKCTMKALKRREVHNTESNISNLNYKIPANLSALSELDLFVCVKCVWGKRPRLAEVKGRIVDVLSEVRLKLPEAIGLLHCLQRTLYVQQEIKLYLTSKEVVQLKELNEVMRETDRLNQESVKDPSSRSSDDNSSSGNLCPATGSGSHDNAGSSRTAGDSLIKQRKHKRKATLIPRIDNDSIAAINREEIKTAGVELLNKGLLMEIHIPELGQLLTFLRHMDRDFGYYPKIKLPAPPKKPPVKKPRPVSPSNHGNQLFSSLIGPDGSTPPGGLPTKKPARIKNKATKVTVAKDSPSPSGRPSKTLLNLPPSPSKHPNYPPSPSKHPNYPPSHANYQPPTANYSPSSNYPASPSNYPPSTSNYPPSTSNYPPPTSNYPPSTSNYPPSTSNYPTSTLNSSNYPNYPSSDGSNYESSTSNYQNYPADPSNFQPDASNYPNYPSTHTSNYPPHNASNYPASTYPTSNYVPAPGPNYPTSNYPSEVGPVYPQSGPNQEPAYAQGNDPSYSQSPNYQQGPNYQLTPNYSENPNYPQDPNYPPPGTNYPQGSNYPQTSGQHPSQYPSDYATNPSNYPSTFSNYPPSSSYPTNPNYPAGSNYPVENYPSSHPSDGGKYPTEKYPTGLTAVAEAAMLSAKMSPSGPVPMGPSGTKANRGKGPKTPGEKRTRAPRGSKTPGGTGKLKSPGTGGKSPGTGGKSPGIEGKSPGIGGKSPGTGGKSPGSNAAKSPGAPSKMPKVTGTSGGAPRTVSGAPRPVGGAPKSAEKKAKEPTATGTAGKIVGDKPVGEKPLAGEKPPPGTKTGKDGKDAKVGTPAKHPRQRKPRTPASDGKGASDSTTPGSTAQPKKRRRKVIEYCDLEDCLEPEGEIDWVQCDKCERWFHFICVGITAISQDDPYVCTYCCNSMSKIDNTEANEDTAVTSLLSLSRGFI